MPKPKLLLHSDWNWAATSPLVYTLQRNTKYAHFGYTKSFKILEPYFKPTNTIDKLKPFSQRGSGALQDLYNRVANGTWENFKSYDPGTHRLNTTQDLEPLRDFPLSHFSKLVKGLPTISKYVDFYSALYEHVVKKGYKSVGDTYSLFKPKTEFIKRFNDTIISEFDVKIIFLTRDPVRRAFSKYLSDRQRTEDCPSYGNPKGVRLNPLPLKLYVKDYIPKILQYNQIFGEENIHVVAMEDLWEDDGTAKKELSDFLDYPITNLWKNLYAPDRGHLVEYDRDVPCQAYGQNLQELTEDIYYHYKSKYQYAYDAWEKHYGSLPLHWGKPLKYK